MLRIKQLTFVIVGIGIGYLINPTTTYSFTLSSLDLNLVEGALGLPDLDNYLSSFYQLYSQVPISTPFGNGNNSVLLADLLAEINPDVSGLLFDIAFDGNIIYSQLPDNNQETVVAPYRLDERYYQLALGDFATQTGNELALSSTGQTAIKNIFDLALISNTNSTTEVNNSSDESLDSTTRANTLSDHTSSITTLADTSTELANSSLTTDTSFQILRNISQQMGIQAKQNNFKAEQNEEIGQILANSSQQLTQQSKQFKEQQSTATHLLKTSQQQQILSAIQATTNGQQLKILTQASTEKNRLDNAAFQHAQQGAGMILIPLAPQTNN
ncbi:hypothetical protein CWATWH0005_3182 [Crocosphaera watsonii WH 0005]|uniref:Uncharacterized protein n=2 Tax=Crocosphaera watsonii TaxID=263511 RepID=T2IRK0_CROWT|nr:hypothetical protein [Crocosphaera watsonii]CCQ55402.1 hypothetical protein CWATWH0005_3182 [Crocosphaera watsonii WH 0005]